MGLFTHKYPYVDAHELNLDWVVIAIKNLKSRVSDIETYISDTLIPWIEDTTEWKDGIDTWKTGIDSWKSTMSSWKTTIDSWKTSISSDVDDLQEDVEDIVDGTTNINIANNTTVTGINSAIADIVSGDTEIDISGNSTITSMQEDINGKQDKLIPGNGIKVYIDNTIEADYKIYSVSDSTPAPDIKIGSGVWNNRHYLIKRKSFIVNAAAITWDPTTHTGTIDISPYFRSNAESFIAKYSVSMFNTVSNAVVTLPIIGYVDNVISIVELLQIDWHAGTAIFYYINNTSITSSDNFLFDIVYYELQPEGDDV